MFILLVGLFSLWIPLYKTICESQGFSVKTSHQDYKFQNRKRNLILINIILIFFLETKLFKIFFTKNFNNNFKLEKFIKELIIINLFQLISTLFKIKNKIKLKLK